MDFARDQLFASAGFALNKHGSVRRRDEINLTDELAQRAALTNQIAERPGFEHLLLQVCVVLFELCFQTLDFFKRTRIQPRRALGSPQTSLRKEVIPPTYRGAKNRR